MHSFKKSREACLQSSKETVSIYSSMRALLSVADTRPEIVLLFLHSTKLMIYEMEVDNQTTGRDFIPTERLECLQRYLDSLDDWFRIFFSMPSAAYLELPVVVFWHQLARSTKSLFELTALNDPGWDQDAVRRRLDFLDIMEKIASSLDSLQELIISNDGVEEDSVKKAARQVRVTKGICEDEIRASQAGTLAPAAAAVGNDPAMNIFFDDQWLTDSLGAWWSLNGEDRD
jgi:hypothetical protein